MRAAITALVLLLLLAGCGVDVQDRPESISIPEPPTTDAGPTTDSGGEEVTVFFVRGARLEAASRSTARPGVESALELLVAGPSRSEVIDGLRTALAPQTLLPEPTGSTRPVITIAVSREFTDVAGGNQLLAVAQVVWTATQVPGIELLRVTADGQPVEVPTDEGLTDDPVGRSDYRSVAPHGEELPSAPGAPSAPGQTPPPRDGDTVPPALPSPGATPTTQRRGPLPRRRPLVRPSGDTADRSADTSCCPAAQGRRAGTEPPGSTSADLVRALGLTNGGPAPPTRPFPRCPDRR